MAKKFCASDGLDEDWKTKAIPLDQKLDVINSGLDNTEEQISKQEVRVMEITQAEQKNELMKMRIA